MWLDCDLFTWSKSFMKLSLRSEDLIKFEEREVSERTGARVEMETGMRGRGGIDSG